MAAAAAASVAVAAIGVARTHAATLTSVRFASATLATKWAVDSGDCPGSVSISDSRAVDAFGYFSGWHASWDGGGCLATSNVKTFHEKDGTYRVAGHPLPAATYYVQVHYCHDSDVSGGYFCRGSDPLSVRITSAVAGTLSTLHGRVLVNGEPAHEGMTIKYGDEIGTAVGASATLNTSRGAALDLGESTTLIPGSPARARIRSGRVRVAADRFFRLSSPNAAAAVMGGIFRLAVSHGWTRERTHDGEVTFGNTNGTRRTVTVTAGHESTVRGSNPPTVPRRF